MAALTGLMNSSKKRWGNRFSVVHRTWRAGSQTPAEVRPCRFCGGFAVRILFLLAIAWILYLMTATFVFPCASLSRSHPTNIPVVDAVHCAATYPVIRLLYWHNASAAIYSHYVHEMFGDFYGEAVMAGVTLRGINYGWPY